MATKKVTPAAAKTTTKKAVEKKVPAAKTTKAKPAITDEDIRKKAEEIYNARVAAGEEGNHESDWLAAEKALKAGKNK